MGALFGGLLTRDVTVQNPGSTVDRYNRAGVDWTNPTSTTVKGWVFISQRRMQETYNNQDQATADGVCFLEPTAPVTDLSRLTISGDRYEVFGVPSLVYTPNGPHHWECRVKRFRG